MIVVDTNVISELMKASPSGVVVDWVHAQSEEEFYTTSVTLAEVLYGIARLPEGRRKDLLRITASEVFATFSGRVLPFDVAAAAPYAMIVEKRDGLGRPIDGFDAQIVAICHAHGALLATRNVKDFQHTDITLIDPWQHA